MVKFFALIPAAGSGSRMGRSLPKQYLPVAGHPLLYHAAACLCAHPLMERVYVLLPPDDHEFANHDWSALGARLKTLRCGGTTRADTVVNGLHAIQGEVSDQDWILVHDAARPCLTGALLDRLVAEAGHDEVGGLLAMPVADTLKRGEGGRVAATEPRDGLWQAQTPQMFRHGLLMRALQSADRGKVTDEASAVENLGLRPRLVRSDLSNLKVTFPEDLALAELILRNS
jgi:2-C-methyl-D-erythritol 4-phosphate cytidylyltransferase